MAEHYLCKSLSHFTPKKIARNRCLPAALGAKLAAAASPARARGHPTLLSEKFLRRETAIRGDRDESAAACFARDAPGRSAAIFSCMRILLAALTGAALLFAGCGGDK